MSSTVPPSTSLSDSLKAIRSRFVTDLDLRSGELRALFGEEEAGMGEGERLQQARRIAHRIAGVAGTLGFPRLGRLAADVDDLIGAALATPDEGRCREARGAIATLTQAMGQVARTDGDCDPVQIRRSA